MSTVNEETWEKGHYLSLNVSNYNTHKSKSRPSSSTRPSKFTSNKGVKKSKITLSKQGPGHIKAKSKDFDIEEKLLH